MLTNYEQFSVTTMMGNSDTPPRTNGTLCFGSEWEREAFGTALFLSKKGFFDWEDFRTSLIFEIQTWESEHSLKDDSWDYYKLWLNALEKTLIKSGVIDLEELTIFTSNNEESQHAY